MGEPANKGRTLPGEVLTADEVSALIRVLRERPERGQERRDDRRDVRRRVAGQRDARPATVRPRPRARDGPCPPRQGRQGAYRGDRPVRAGVRRAVDREEGCARAERTAAALLHYHPERPVRGRPRLLLRPSATPDGWPTEQASSVASTRMRCATRWPPRWPTRGRRCRRSAPSSGTRRPRSPTATYGGSPRPSSPPRSETEDGSPKRCPRHPRQL